MTTTTFAAFPDDDDDKPDDTSAVVDNTLGDNDLIPRPDPKVWKPTLQDPFPTFRCTKTMKNGERCKNMGLNGMLPDNAKCIQHGGKQLSVKEKARARVDAVRLRMAEDTGLAMDVIEGLLSNSGTADQIRLKAAESVLDRAGIRAGVEIDVSGEVQVNTAEQVRERLALGKIDKNDDEEDIVDAEIVEDEEDEQSKDITDVEDDSDQ